MKRKELRKLLGHFLKLNSSLTAGNGSGTGQKNLTALQAKLHYLKIISDLPSYGAKCFSTNMSVSIQTSNQNISIDILLTSIARKSKLINFYFYFIGFKRRNCDSHQSQVRVKSNQ